MHALIEVVERHAAPDVRTVIPRRDDIILDLAECIASLDVVQVNVLVYEGATDDDTCVGIWRWYVGEPYKHADGTTWCDAHRGDRCLGWYLGRDGSIEPCEECWPEANIYDVRQAASRYFHEHDEVRHEPDDECPGCPES